MPFHRLCLLLVATLAITSCSKFLKTESENLTPFANQTISLISNLDYGLSDNDILYLRKIDDYIDSEKSFDRFDALEHQAERQLKALVTYSIQMVTISEQNLSENQKSNEFADILVVLSDLIGEDEVIVDANRDTERTKNIMAQVRTSEDYLESLRILLPAINDFTAHAIKVLDELELEKRNVVSYIDQAIDNKYGKAIAFEQELRLLRNKLYDSLIALSRYNDTRDTKYIEQARKVGVLPVVDALKGKNSLTNKELIYLHKVLTERMAMVNENYKQLKPDYDEYFSSHSELKRLLDAKNAGLREARLTFIVWSRAYQKMALGKTDPAEWFDISESGTLLMGAAGRAAGL